MSAHRWKPVLLLCVALCTTITAWALERPRFDLRGHKGAVRELCFHPEGDILASISTEDAIRIWSISAKKQLRTLTVHGRTVDRHTAGTLVERRLESIAFSSRGDMLAEAAVTGSSGTVRLWDYNSGEQIRLLTSDARNVRAVAFSPDGKVVAANMRDGVRSDHKIALFDVQTGKIVGEFRGDRLAATMLAFSPDGRTLISAGARKIHIWDVATRRVRHTISTHKKTILDIAFAPDNVHFASCDADEKVRIWDAQTGNLDREFEHEQDGVEAVAYSPTGRTLATGGKDGTIKLWSPKTSKHRSTLWGHSDRILCLAFAPTSDVLASGSRDGTISIWSYEEPAEDQEENAGDDEEDEDEDED